MAKKQLKTISDLEKMALECNVNDNPLFQSTLDRYITQINVLEDLKKEIKNNSAIVEKQYVKGKVNVYSNPAIVQYNRTTDSANKTASCLMKIINNFKDNSANEEDPLLKTINNDDYGE